MSVEFGDVEPEDAWDPGDTPAEQVENLRRRVVLLIVAALRAGDTDAELRDVLTMITVLVAIARLRGLNTRGLLRAAHLEEDIALIRNRLGP